MGVGTCAVKSQESKELKAHPSLGLVVYSALHADRLTTWMLPGIHHMLDEEDLGSSRDYPYPGTTTTIGPYFEAVTTAYSSVIMHP